MTEFEQLQNRIDNLEKIISALVGTDRYIFQKTIQIMDGRKIQLGKGTGTMIGTEATQKIGFLGATPIVQQGIITPPTGGATIDSAARTAINAIITDLQKFGLTA